MKGVFCSIVYDRRNKDFFGNFTSKERVISQSKVGQGARLINKVILLVKYKR